MNVREVEKKVGVIILVYGIIILLFGIFIFIPNVENIENTVGEFWIIVLMSLMFTGMSAIPTFLYFYVKDKRENDSKKLIKTEMKNV